MALIDTTGAYAAGYTYDPYGKTTTVNGTSTTAANNNPWRYTGGYQDPTDGYYHFGARYYDAAGHFTQADSIGGSLLRPEKYNGYVYAAGDPINSTDLAGTSPLGAAANAFVATLAGLATATFCAGDGIACFFAGVIYSALFGAFAAIVQGLIDGDSSSQLIYDAIDGAIAGAVGGALGPLVGKVVGIIKNMRP